LQVLDFTVCYRTYSVHIAPHTHHKTTSSTLAENKLHQHIGGFYREQEHSEGFFFLQEKK